MKKRSCLTIFIITLALVGFISAPAMATEKGKKPNVYDNISDSLTISGLVEFAAGWTDIDYKALKDITRSELALARVEMAFDAQVNEWVNVHALLYYERPLFDAAVAGQPVWDEAIVTIGNTEKFPLFLAAGLLYAPFGVQTTHLPGDPALLGPLTLNLGESQREAVAVGASFGGLTATVYGLRGHWDANLNIDNNEDSEIGTYGADLRYEMASDNGPELLVGVSYLSNVAESDLAVETLTNPPFLVTELADDYKGAAAYFQFGIAGFFFDVEYMTALDEITELGGLEPAAWNAEVGYGTENLELVFQYAGTEDLDTLLPEKRIGVGVNWEVVDKTTVSLAYFTDEFYGLDDKDTQDTLVAVVGVEF